MDLNDTTKAGRRPRRARRAALLLTLGLLTTVSCEGGTSRPDLLVDRDRFEGVIHLTLATGAKRTELRGRLVWSKAEGSAVWEDGGGSRTLRLSREGAGGPGVLLEIDGEEAALDAAGRDQMFALSALLFQSPRETAEVTPLEGGVDGYRIAEGDRSLVVRLGASD